jgi:DNA mismatch endonuclease (patch repair protein)
MRFRKTFRVRASDVTSVPDVTFTRQRIAVFLDGCFWHMCPEHGTMPSHNRAYWQAKLQGNAARDLEVSAGLERGGWRVLRFWEHEEISQAAETIEAAVRSG